MAEQIHGKGARLAWLLIFRMLPPPLVMMSRKFLHAGHRREASIPRAIYFDITNIKTHSERTTGPRATVCSDSPLLQLTRSRLHCHPPLWDLRNVLLIPQRHYRIHRHRSPRRNRASKHTRQRQHQRHHRERRRIARRDSHQHDPQRVRQPIGHRQPQRHTQRQRQSLAPKPAYVGEPPLRLDLNRREPIGKC